MSHYDSEHGTLKLPSAETARLKKAVRDAYNGQRDAAKRLAKEFWQGPAKRTKDRGKYDAAVDAYIGGLHDRHTPRHWSLSVKPPPCDLDDLHYLLSSVAHAPHQVTEDDVSAVFGEKATNRTNRFKVGDDAVIAFDGNTVTWDVAYNNHAREHAHEHPTARAFFGALNRVQWTRGTGGEFYGTDEYTEDDWGGGREYKTGGYGPLGDPDHDLGRAVSRARSRTPVPNRGGLGSNQYQRR